VALKDVLVTGGSGFLGMALVRRLVDLGHPVRVLDINEPNDPRVEASIQFVKGDVRDASLIGEACRDVDTVFHLAAAVLPTRGKKSYTSTNTGGTRNVLQACQARGVQHVVHISTSAVYGVPQRLPVTEETEFGPMGYYGNAKFQGEREVRLARQRGLRVCILRPRTIIGTERLGIFHILFDWIKSGKRIPMIGPGDNLFQFISARDVVEASLLAAGSRSNDDFNIGAEEFSTVRADLEALVSHAGSGSRVVSIPAPLAKVPLQVLDILRLSPLMDWQYKVADKPFYFDVSKAKRELGWQPQDSNVRMFTDSYDWYVQNFTDSASVYGSTHRQAVRQRALRLLRSIF
jgi:nucleoside-diphosphate-sugar epimerase